MWCTSRCAVVKGGAGCRGPCGLWVVGYGRASDHDGCRGDDEFNLDDVLDHHFDHDADHHFDHDIDDHDIDDHDIDDHDIDDHDIDDHDGTCLLYTSPSPRDQRGSRMPSSA